MHVSRNILEASPDRDSRPQLVNLHHSDGRAEYTQKTDILAWILVVVLAVVIVVASYVFWIKAGGN